MNTKTKKTAALGMLAAVAYVAMLVGRFSLIPAVPFLQYDPKDVIIVIGGFIWGPFSAFIISLVVSLVEMVTVSDTGLIGCAMNIISTCSFACTAAYIYKKRRTIDGAIISLFAGVIFMVAVMVLWNYVLTPIYMKIPRAEVVKLLLPAILPFNLIKGSLNAGLTILLYKPIVLGLRKTRFLPQPQSTKGNRINAGMVILGVFILVSCILIILALKGIL
ncbi:MAG: ECF transporter S component [Saccharofermentanales bacterium]|jgi:riboflavin transporter FmnP